MFPINVGPNDIRAFVEVARSGGFRRAAAALGSSQPTLTDRIRRLEAAVGLALFERTTRRVTLTEAGARLLQRCERPLNEIDGALRDLRVEASFRNGRFSMGASPTIAATLLPSLVERFIREHPSIHVSLIDDLAGPLLEKLATGAIDFALLPMPKPSEDFRFEILYSEPMVFVAPRSFALPANRPLRIDELVALPFVTMPPPSIVWRMLEQTFAAAGRTFHPIFEANNATTLLGLVAAGIGLTLMPDSAVGSGPVDAVAIRVENLSFHRRVTLVSHRARELPRAALPFLHLIRTELVGPKR